MRLRHYLKLIWESPTIGNPGSLCVREGADFCLSAIWDSLPHTVTYCTRHQVPRAQRHIWTVPVVRAKANGRHFSRSTYKFCGAWWLRVASWGCFSGFIVQRNSCSTSLACLFSDWIRFSRKKSCFLGGRTEPDFGFSLLPCHFTMKERRWRLLFPKTTCTY